MNDVDITDVAFMSFDELGLARRSRIHMKMALNIGIRRVYLIGYDNKITKKFLNQNNQVTFKKIRPFHVFAVPFSFLLFPIKIVYMITQLVGVMKTIRTLDILYLYLNGSFISVIYGYIIGRLKGAKFFVDISLKPLSTSIEGSNRILKLIENLFLKFSDTIIVSTLAKFLIMKLRGIPTKIIEDSPVENHQLISYPTILQKKHCIALFINDLSDSEIADYGLFVNRINSIMFIHVIGERKHFDQFKNVKNTVFHCVESLNMDFLCECDIVLFEKPCVNVIDVHPLVWDVLSFHVPMIVNREGCITEVVFNGKNGIIFDTKEMQFDYVFKLSINASGIFEMKKQMNEYCNYQIEKAKTQMKSIMLCHK